MSGKFTHAKVNEQLHLKMKRIAASNNRNVQEEYELAIRNHIAEGVQKEILVDSKLESVLNERVKKMEDRIVAMQARNGMDTSIVLVLLLEFASRVIKVDKNELYESARKRATAYFSKPYQKEKTKE